MADDDYGPFADERQALATRAAALIRAAYDAAPGTGATFPAALKVMTDACEAAGVELGAYDLSPLRQLSYAETGQCVALAGIIRRAFEAGKAAGTEGAVTEWGLRYEGDDGEVIIMPYPEEEVRQMLRESDFRSPGVRKTAVTRQAGPWKEARGDEG